MGSKGAESPERFDVSPTNSARDVMCEQACGWWSCQSPVAHSCGLLNHPNSFCKGMFELYTKSDTDLLLYWLSHFECNSHTVHMLTQPCLPPPLTATMKSLFTHAHSSLRPLPSKLHWCCTSHSHYVTMAGLFPDRLHHIIDLHCFLSLVSSSVNASIFHITWPDTFWTDFVCTSRWLGS